MNYLVVEIQWLPTKMTREKEINFINLDMESVDDRWRGKCQEFTLAVWNFAEMIQPCIIYIDEIGNLIIL